jgi:hypothetical protein
MTTLQMAGRIHQQRARLPLGTTLLLVGLALVTAAIHVSLGGMLFLANATGYTVLAAALVAPGPLANVRSLVRVAMIAFTAMTIGGWLLFGARFPLAYVDKAIEVALIVVVAIDLFRIDRGPRGIARDVRHLVGRVSGSRRLAASR